MEYYPAEFSQRARSAVEAELIRAWRKHLERKQSNQQFDEERSLRTCVMDIFLTYAREALALGRRGTWAVDKVRAQAMEGLRLITIEITHSKARDFKHWVGWRGGLQEAAMCKFEEMGPWRTFEEELLILATRDSNGETLQSWHEIRSRFLQGSTVDPGLSAHWDSRQELWTLRAGNSESEGIFKETAKIGIARLGKSGAAAPSWHVWLDLMRNEKRGFRRILKPRTGSEFRRIVESDEPLDLSEVPLSKDGGIAQVFKEAADFCADLESREQTPEATWASGPRNQDSPAARGPFQEIAKVEPSQLPELPPKFQHAFEAAKANAELVQAKLARRIPHPALSGISRLKLIQDVFFAYCAQARAACRAGELTLTQMRQVTETALPVICDLYFIRDYGTGSDDARSTFRVQFTRVVADDPQWRQHLSEVAELAEGASPTSGGTTGGAGGNPSTAKANDTPPKVRAAPLDVAHPKRLQSTISSPLAARRVEAYLDSNPMKRTEFAVQAQTTDRTLRSFRKTGKVRRDIFENIAKAMGVTPEALLKQE